MNGYPELLVNRVNKFHRVSLSENKPYRTEKLHVVLKLPYASNISYLRVNK